MEGTGLKVSMVDLLQCSLLEVGDFNFMLPFHLKGWTKEEIVNVYARSFPNGEYGDLCNVVGGYDTSFITYAAKAFFLGCYILDNKLSKSEAHDAFKNYYNLYNFQALRTTQFHINQVSERYDDWVKGQTVKEEKAIEFALDKMGCIYEKMGIYD